MAKVLGYSIQPSKKPNKKIDVYDNGKYKFSIGNIGYGDFPTYAKHDMEYALERRRLYHLRNQKNNVVGTRGHATLNILW